MAKYISLRLLGIPSEQLRVAVVKPLGDYYHVVLYFFPQNETDPWVLDYITYEHLGFRFIDSHILRLSERMRMILHKIKPLWGVNENFMTEFQGGLNEKITNTDPRHKFPKFSMALINSQRLLPPERG